MAILIPAVIAAAIVAQAQPKSALSVYGEAWDATPMELRGLMGKMDFKQPHLRAASPEDAFSSDRLRALLLAQSDAIKRITEASRRPTLGVDPLPAWFLDPKADGSRASAARCAKRIILADVARAWDDSKFDVGAERLATAIRMCVQISKGPSFMDAMSSGLPDTLDAVEVCVATGQLSAKGREAIATELRRINRADPEGLRARWFEDAERWRTEAAKMLLGPEGRKKWNDYIQAEGRDEHWYDDRVAALGEMPARDREWMRNIWRGLPLIVKGYSATALTSDEVNSKIATSKKLAERLNASWDNPQGVVDEMIKAADEDKSQIVRVTLCNAFAVPHSSEQSRTKLNEFFDRFDAKR